MTTIPKVLADPEGIEARLIEIQALVVRLIHYLLAAGLSEVDKAIEDCLADLGNFANRDRAYVFVAHDGVVSNTHEWCAPGIAPMIDQLQNLSGEDYAALLEPLSANQVVLIPDIADFLPGSMEHELLAAQEIRSLVMVPMLDDSGLFGLVGFDSVTARGDFRPAEVYLLRAFADVVRAVLMRRKAMLEMRRAQDELARERAFLQGIVSTDAAAFLVFDEQGAIIYANEAAEDVLVLPVEELLGERYDSPKWGISDLSGKAFASADHPYAKVCATGEIVRDHRIALHCDDGLRYASINAAPILTASKRNHRVVYAVTDVTAQVEAEKAREAALEAAHRANEAKSNFLANMSHELRTPLNGILGIADILNDSLVDPSQQQMVKILRDSGSLLMTIIDDLLDMTKIEADALELEVIPVDLAQLAQRIEEVHTLRASEKQLSFSVTLEDACSQERLGDPHRLMQILHNLISNALKFTETGFVRVKISAPDAEIVTLCVEDSGIGMTEDQARHVLEAFAQADSSISRRFGGTGLGMSIVRRLVEMMEGALKIESAPGEGTRITITLPLRLAVELEPLPAPVPSGPEQLPALSVLAADDNRTNQMILGLMLGQLGARVTLADDGLAALETYRNGSFDLLILDISMPQLDGVALLQRLRAEEAREGKSRVPALAFTANAMTHQVQSYLDAGFDGCLTKPLKLDRLRAAIAELFVQTVQPDPALTEAAEAEPALRDKHAHGSVHHRGAAPTNWSGTA